MLLARTLINLEIRVSPFWALLNIEISVCKSFSDKTTPPEIEYGVRGYWSHTYALKEEFGDIYQVCTDLLDKNKGLHSPP